MTRLFSLKKIVFAAVAVAGLSFAAGSADAGHYGCDYGYGYNDYYVQRIVTYDYDRIADYHDHTRYTDCGVPYQVRVLHTRTVAVPVVSYVRVAY